MRRLLQSAVGADGLPRYHRSERNAAAAPQPSLDPGWSAPMNELRTSTSLSCTAPAAAIATRSSPPAGWLTLNRHADAPRAVAAAPEARGRIVMSVRFSGARLRLAPPKALASHVIWTSCERVWRRGCRRTLADVRGAELRRARALSQSGHHVPRAGTGDVRRRAARRAGLCYPMNSHIDARQLTFCSWDGLGMSCCTACPARIRVNLSTSIVNAVGSARARSRSPRCGCGLKRAARALR